MGTELSQHGTAKGRTAWHITAQYSMAWHDEEAYHSTAHLSRCLGLCQCSVCRVRCVDVSVCMSLPNRSVMVGNGECFRQIGIGSMMTSGHGVHGVNIEKR